MSIAAITYLLMRSRTPEERREEARLAAEAAERARREALKPVFARFGALDRHRRKLAKHTAKAIKRAAREAKINQKAS